MPITREELDSFHHFASARLNNGGAASLEDCLRQWRAAGEEEALVADIRQGLLQANAGLLRPLADVDAEIRARFGFPVRR